MIAAPPVSPGYRIGPHPNVGDRWPLPGIVRALPWSVPRPASTPCVARLAHGAYERPDHPVEQWLADLATTCELTQGAVVCLGTAAHFEMLQPVPPCRPTVLVAGGASSGRRSVPSARYVVPGHPDELVIGIIEDVVRGVPVRRTAPARTVVDLARRCRRPTDEKIVAVVGQRYLDMSGDLEELHGIADRLRTPSRAREILERIGQAPVRAAS